MILIVLETIRQQKKLLITLAALFTLVGLFLGAVQAFLASQDVAGNIRQLVQAGLEDALQVPVRIDGASVGVFGRLTFTGISIGAKSQIRAEKAIAHYNILAYLSHRDDPAAAVTAIDLVRPVVEATMDKTGRWDVIEMFKTQTAPGVSAPANPAYPVRLRDGIVLLKGLDVVRMDAALWAAGGPKPSDTPELIMARGHAPKSPPIRFSGVSGVVKLTGGPDVRLDLGGALNLAQGRRVSLSGVLGWRGDVPVFKLALSGADLDAVGLWRLVAFPEEFGWAQAGSGRLEADLSLDESGAFDYKVRYALANGLYTGPGPLGQMSSVSGDVVVTTQAIEFERFGFSYRGSHWALSGKIRPAATPVLDLNVNTNAADLAQVPRRLLETFGVAWPDAGLSLTGKAQVALAIRGPGNSLLFSGSVRPKGASLAWKPAVLPLTGIEGEIVLDGQTASARELTGRWGEAQVKVSGEINGLVDLTTARLALDVTARGVKGADLAQLAGPTDDFGRMLRRSGLTASGEALVSGKPTDPAVAGSFAVTSGRVEPWDLKGLSGSFRYAQNLLEVTRAGWKLLSGDLQGKGSISWSGAAPEYAFSLAAKGIPLSAFTQVADFGLEGDLSGTLAAKGRGWDQKNLILSAQGSVKNAVTLGEPLRELTGQVAMTGGQLSLDYLRAEGAQFKLTAGGLLDEPSDLHLALTVPRIERLLSMLPSVTGRAAGKRFWTGDPGRLSLLGQVAAWGRDLRALDASGSVTLEGRLTGRVGGFAYAGLLDWNHASLAGQKLDRADARLRIDGSRLDVSSLEIADGATTVRGAGTVELATGRLVGVWLKTGGVDIRKLLDLAGLGAGSGAAPGAKPGAVSGAGSGNRAVAESASGAVDVVLRAGGSLAKPALSGEATLVRGEFLGKKVSQARLRFSSLELASAGGWPDFSRSAWKVDEARVTGPWGRLSASGTAGPAGPALSVQGEGLKLEEVVSVLAGLGVKADELASLDGSADVTGKVNGTWSRPQFDGSATVLDPAFAAYRFDRLSGKFTLRDGLLEVPTASLTRNRASYSVSGQVRLQPAPTYDFRVETAGSALSGLADIAGIKLPAGVDGAVTGSAHLWGAGGDVSARLTADVANGHVAGLGVTGGADVAFGGGQVTINRLRLEQGKGVFSASGTIGRDQALSLSLTAGRFDGGTLASVLRLPYAMGGTVDLKGQLSGRLDAPIADLGFTVRNGSIQSVAVEELTGGLAYKNGVLSLRDGAIRRGGRVAEVSGAIPLPAAALRSLGLTGVAGAKAGEQMDLTVKMPQGDFSLVTLIDPALSIPSGTGSLELHLGGTWQKPLVNGQVRVSNAVARYQGVPGEATGLNALIDFDGQKVLVRTFSARYLGGTVSVRGTIDIGPLWPQAMDLTASAAGVQYQAPFLDAGIDATITMRGAMPRPAIRGRVTASRVRADFAKWPGGLDALSASGKITGVGGVGGNGSSGSSAGGNSGGSTRFDPTFDVSLEPKGDFHAVAADLVDIYGNGQVSVRGSLSQPSLSGRLDVTRGTLNYLQTPFAITDGRAEFASYRGLIPYLNVTAETVASDTSIRLLLTGPADRLTQTLTSDPPLPEDQIVALLGLPGRISRFAEGDTRAALESEMLQLFDEQVSGRLLSSLEQKVKDVLQLDEFRIKAGLGIDSVSVQLGKYLFDNLYVSYSRTFTQKPYEAFRLELRLTPSMLLSTGLDNTGDLRLGVETKFRF